MKRILLLISLIVLGVPSAQAVTIFGEVFDDNAFSDNATHVSGSINYLGFSKDGLPITGDDDIDLDTALNGPDLYAFIEGIGDSSTKSPYVVDIEFIDNYIFNGAGADLIVWERGLAEPVGIAVYDPRFKSFTSSVVISSVKLGDLVDSVDVSSGVNAAYLNLDVWGIPSDLAINKFRLFGGNGGDPSADIAAIGGLNSRTAVIPEPSTLILLAIGLTGLFFKRNTL